MTSKEIRDELNNLLQLLKLEKEEDFKQYKLRIQNTSPVERRKSGVCWYPVRLDRTSYNSAERLMVRVSRNKEHRESHMFQSGKLVSLFSNVASGDDEDAVNGVVNMVRDHEMIITLNSDYEPDWLYRGKIGVQLLFDENTYREMEKGIKELVSNSTQRLDALKSILLGGEEAAFEEVHPIRLPELNDSQNDALNKVLSAKDLAIIHGPPGTGKTTTLIQTILHTLKSENQVLVCAPSNAAVDLIVEKLVQMQIDVVRIGHPARVTNMILEQTLDSKKTQHKQYKELRNLRKQFEEYRKLGHKYKRNFGPSEREQRKLLLAEANRFRLEAEMLSDYIKDDILTKTRVIATTLVGANNYAIKDLQFTTVFIDEAAQGLEPATWLPIMKADRVIFAGDHCQLPPTIKSYDAAKGGLEITLFEKSIQRNSANVMLTEQYRMHNDIMQFSSKQFYHNELKAHPSVKDQTIVPEDLVVEFIDTAGCGFAEESDPETKSSLNKEEMSLLFKHLTQYLESITTLKMEDNLQDIGVISPYKAQVSLMQETFESVELVTEDLKQKIAINTIDSFQGQERDIIYISLVRSNEKGEIGFLKDTRRMNVAMTRARKKLVIIGDSATVCNHPFYNDFLDYVNELGAYKSAYEYLY
ncbi:MAG: AAA domain-containing protein [Bacteroidales bacterium]|nr:AAA domain-containing protein [Bacteroidales bacterium]